jgi:UDP-N-acetylglucosamine pyrophosphorylase
VKGVICLPQENLPILDYDGKVILETAESVGTRPIGTGGFFRCLVRDGILNQLKTHGVVHLNIVGIDNLECGRLSPYHIGYVENEEIDGLVVCSEVETNSKYYSKHFPVFVKHQETNQYSFFNHGDLEIYSKQSHQEFDKVLVSAS